MNTEFQNSIIEKIKKLKSQQEDGSVYITQGLQKLTKNIVRKAKKYYESIFEKATDDSIFYPYTKAVADSIIANLDFDTKDILITSKKTNSRAKTLLARELLRYHLDKHNFGLTLNEAISRYVIDGTVVLRTTEKDGHPETEIVDLENFWTEFSSNKPNWYLERILMPKNSVPESWEEIANTSTTLLPNLGNPDRDFIEVYRYEGLMPLSWITENSEHQKTVWGVLFITGLSDGQKTKIQEKRILGDNREASSYDYAQFTSHSTRFIGIGIPESLFNLQEYLNSIINNRHLRSNLASTGLMLIRKGSGITPDLLDQLAHGGGIPVVDTVKDIRQLPVSDVSPVSFNEEQRLIDLGDKLTGSTQVSRGQRDSSGITLGQIEVEAGFSTARFKFQRQNFAFMVRRIVKRWLEIIAENMDEEEVINVSDENARMELARELANSDYVATLEDAFNKFGERGLLSAKDLFSPAMFFEKRMKANHFKLLKKSLKNLDYEIDISLTNENMDRASTTRNLLQLLQLAPNVPNLDTEAVVEKTYEMLGISTIQFKKPKELAPVQAGLAQ